MSKYAMLALAVVVGACQTNPLTGKDEVNFYSAEEEAGLGREVAPAIEAELGGVYEDPVLQDYVDGLTKKVAKTAPVQEEGVRYEYYGRVLNSPVVNAFSLPGGPVYVTRGLLLRMHNEAELAGVLGHEVAHIAGRHGTNRISEAQLTQALLAVGIVGASVAADRENAVYVGAGAVVATAIGQLYILGHSRDHEYQSDHYGAGFAWHADYDPKALMGVFETFEQMRQESGSSTPEFLQTHPNPENRIARLQTRCAELDGNRGAAAYVLREGEYKSAISGLASNTEALGAYDQGTSLMARGELAAAVAEFDRSIAANRFFSFSHAARGECLSQLGRGGEARTALAEAVRLNPNNIAARKGYGAALAAAGDAAGAEQQYRAAATLNAFDEEARLGLAQSMEAQGREADAARQRALVGEIRSGRARGQIR